MYILGIETSCDDTAAAVIEAKGGLSKPVFSVLANTSYSQVAIHKKFGGIVPNLASRAHLQKIIPTIKSAISISEIDIKDIDLIAVTRGPGLLPSLLIGVNAARALAYKCKKPIIGVNHIEGHIYSNWLPPIGNKQLASLKRERSEQATSDKKIKFPALILIVSGGHTELVLMRNYGKYKIIGQTLDDAAGECFDKTARLLGLGFPGGPAIAALAGRQVPSSKLQVRLPRPMINSKDYNFSFSGLKTAVLYLYNDLIKKYPAEEIKPAMANEIQNAIADVLTDKTTKAAEKLNPKIIMICGGVSANKKLREKMAEKIKPYQIPLFIPDLAYTTDNAAMIAAAGYFSAQGGLASGRNYPSKDSWKKIEANANLEL